MPRLGLVLLVVATAVLGQDAEPSSPEGQGPRFWVERLAEGQKGAKDRVLEIGAPCVPVLLDRMADAQDDSYWEMYEALRGMGGKAAEPLLEHLRAGHASTRPLALGLLLRLESPPTGLFGVLPKLLSDPDKETRIQSALLLCDKRIYLAEEVSPLLEGLRVDIADVRGAAATHLASFPQEMERIVPALLEATKDPVPGVRHLVFGALGAYWVASPSVQARIRNAYDSKIADERVGAVIALSRIPSPPPDVVAKCLEAAGDPDGSVRDEAVRALRRLWLDARVPLGVSRDALAHESAAVRKLACAAAGLSDGQVRADVLARLNDPSEDVRLAALDALARIGDRGPHVHAALRSLLADRSQRVSTQAAWVMIGLDEGSEEALVFLIREGAVLDLAAALGRKAAVAAPALRKMLENPAPHSLGDVAWALYVVTGEAGTPLQALRHQLERGDSFAKVRACIYVARFGREAATLAPVLTGLLGDGSADVRRYAATALGYVDTPSGPSVSRLKELLDDHESRESAPRHHVCRHAAAALAWLDVDDSRIKELLARVIDEWDPNDGSTRPGALRYFWKHGLMPAAEVVDRCTQSLDPPNWEDALPIIRLLGEIGAAARPAIPALESFKAARYEIRTAAEDSMRSIQSK